MTGMNWNEFQNVVDIVQGTKKAEKKKKSLLVYDNKMISWNYFPRILNKTLL